MPPALQTPAPGPAPAVRQATAREFFAIVFRRKWLIAGLFIVSSLTVLAIAISTPNIFISTARILIKRGEQQSMLVPYRQVTDDWESEMASDVAIVRSNPVIVRAREILAAESPGHAPALIAGNVDADVMGKSNVITIGYEDADPKVAQRVCDALVRSYIDYRQNVLTLSYPEGFFGRELAQVRKDLEDWTERRRRFANQSHVANAGDQTRSLLNNLGDLQRRRSELDAELSQVRSTYSAMEDMRTRPDAAVPPLSGEGQGEDALGEMKRRVIEQEARVAVLRERYRDDSPEVVNANETLETLRGLLAREVAARMDLSTARIKGLESAISGLDRSIASTQAQISAMPDIETKIAEMDREIEVLRQRYQSLSQDADQARVTKNTSTTVSIVLLSPAGMGTSKTSRDYVRLALAPVFSLVIGIGLAFFLDGLDATVRTASQAEEAIDLPVLATIDDRRRRAGR
jgi:polysaccharide biosynthesis transport protein